jgi:predicted Zn-dependent peptidase
VVAASDPGDLDEVVDLVVAEVDDLARSGPTEAELAVATGFLVGALELAEEDSASRMVGLGAAVCDRDELPDLEADLAAIRAVTVDEVGRLAGELLTADPVTVRVRPDRERAPLRRS